MQHEIAELDARGLRDFGLVTGGIIAVLFGLFFPWLLDIGLPMWPFVLGGVLAVWGLVAPTTLRPVYKVWMKFGFLMHSVMTPLILGIIFYLVFFPAGIIMRIFRADPMKRKYDSGAPSYRAQSHEAGKKNMENPF